MLLECMFAGEEAEDEMMKENLGYHRDIKSLSIATFGNSSSSFEPRRDMSLRKARLKAKYERLSLD